MNKKYKSKALFLFDGCVVTTQDVVIERKDNKLLVNNQEVKKMSLNKEKKELSLHTSEGIFIISDTEHKPSPPTAKMYLELIN